MQSAAEPDTVVITAATQQLVAGMFVVEDLGRQALKGKMEPVTLYRVVRPSGVRSRLDIAAGRFTPFIGREAELATLEDRWEQARDGEGQVITIIGEAGIGKSRLVHRFHERIQGTPHSWVECAAAPFYQNTPFYPVAAMLPELLDMRSGRLDAEQLAQLEPRMAAAGLDPAEAIPLIAPLLNLPVPDRYPPSSMPLEQQRRRLLAMLVQLVLGAARVQPLVLTTEDLHWADPSTLELIAMLVEQGATSRLLLLYTARPEFYPQWPLRMHHGQITLNRLTTRDARAMVDEVAAQRPLSEETVAIVVERTGGVPLYVEELTRAVLEDGTNLAWRTIPATLHDSLMARLDRLGSAKEIVQIASVIGGKFSYELLHAVHPIAEADLQRSLRALADAGLLYVRGLPPDASYQFKHALIREVAYEVLLKSRRRELHACIVRTLEKTFPSRRHHTQRI